MARPWGARQGESWTPCCREPGPGPIEDAVLSKASAARLPPAWLGKLEFHHVTRSHRSVSHPTLLSVAQRLINM